MKKILSFILCLVMVLCSAVTVFATEATPPADGTVLYAKTFDGEAGSPKSLADAGLETFEADSSFSAGVDPDTGLLKIEQTGSKYSNIVWTNDIIKGLKTYTMQVTFRWVNIASTAAGINVGTTGYDTETKTLNNKSPANVRGSQNKVDGYGDLNKDVSAAWAPSTNVYGTNIPGNWTTVTVEANDGDWGKLTLETVGADPVVFESSTSTNTFPGGNPYLRFGNPLELEIYDIRLVAGIGENIDMCTPELPARPVPTGDFDLGNVLYYQSFNKNVDLADTGLTVYDGANGIVTIDDDGYLRVDNSETGQTYTNMFKLPDVIDDELTTYTLELKFRYVSSANHGGIQPSWQENSATSTTNRTSLFFRYNNDANSIKGAIDNVATANPVSDEIREAWQAGGWMNVKIAIMGGCVSNVSLMVEEKDTGKQLTWSTAPELTSVIPYNKDVFVRAGAQTVAQFASIRVVEGVDYTAYKGEYATKSYSGYEDPMVNNVGIQMAINDNAVRLVGEIRGIDFNAAGFNMKIHYKDSEGNVKESSAELAPEAVHTAYTSIKTGNGVATPSSLNYYFIVLEISEIPTDAKELTITFQPYAKSDSGEYTGATYEFDYVNKAFIE